MSRSFENQREVSEVKRLSHPKSGRARFAKSRIRSQANINIFADVKYRKSGLSIQWSKK